VNRSDSTRRRLIAVVGNARLPEGDERLALAREVGRRLVDAGHRVVTGGLGGIMSAAHEGARTSSRYREGDTIALLPGFDPAAANPFADIVIPTGLDVARNVIVANSDAVVAIGGGAGTLSEMALAWQLRRLVVALRVAGWSGELAGTIVDDRVRQPSLDVDLIHPAESAAQAVEIVQARVGLHDRRHRSV
jgi:uncharacterized protein (TIGR00725 family)